MNFESFFKEGIISSSSIDSKGKNQPPVHDLSKNESFIDIGPVAKRAIADKLIDLSWNKYPGVHEEYLLNAVAAYAGVQPDNILLGSGSSYIISLLLDVFSHRPLVIPQPTFLLYEHYAKLRQTKIILWNLTEEFEYKLDNLDNVTPGSIIVICSPNNPTGTVMSEEVLVELLTQNQESLVIIDEAYCDFNTIDFTAYISKFENLILIRSFSKAFSSAGIRLGYAISQPGLINQLKKIKNPFIINPFTAITAAHILTDNDCMKLIKDNIETVVYERERVHKILSDKIFSGLLKTYRSYGNFNYIKFYNEKDFQFLCNQLIIYKIGVQVFEKQNAVRITIGSKSQNDLILDIFKTILLVD